jgi:cyanophycinase
MRGQIALVGSGEFLPVMDEVDTALLAGRARVAVFLPTAAGQEGDERVDYWLDLGQRHFEGLGVKAVGLRVLDTDDANDPAFAEQIAGAGLIYLSGGNPPYLADTLRDSLVWRAILAAHEAGASLAGCSAGACALSGVAGGFRDPNRYVAPGLGPINHLAVIPHFDRFDDRFSDLASDFKKRIGDQFGVIGVDEDTAIVGGPYDYEVMGRQNAVWIEADGSRQIFGPGDRVRLEPGKAPERLG